MKNLGHRIAPGKEIEEIFWSQALLPPKHAVYLLGLKENGKNLTEGQLHTKFVRVMLASSTQDVGEFFFPTLGSNI